MRTDDLDERETPFANQPPGTPDAREESIGEGAMPEAPRAPGDPEYERKVPKREALQYNARRSRFPLPPGGKPLAPELWIQGGNLSQKTSYQQLSTDTG